MFLRPLIPLEPAASSNRMHDCRNVIFPYLLVGAEASGACALTFSVKFADLRTRKTGVAHVSGQNGSTQRQLLKTSMWKDEILLERAKKRLGTTSQLSKGSSSTRRDTILVLSLEEWEEKGNEENT